MIGPSPAKGASPKGNKMLRKEAGESAGVAAGVAASPLFVIALLVAAIILTRKKSLRIWAKTEEQKPTSRVMMYPLIDGFSDFGRDFGQNNEQRKRARVWDQVDSA
jgi:hypothetical protein